MKYKVPIRLIGVSPLGHKIFTNNNSNHHVLIMGISGSGKTYLNYNLILQDILNNIPVIIIDVANSFKYSEMPDTFKKLLSGRIVVYNATRDMLPINPFALKEYIDDGERFIETPVEVASRIVSLLEQNCNFGSRQYSSTLRVLISMLEEMVASNLQTLTFESLIDRLNIADKFAAQAADKIFPITSCIKFSDTNIDIWHDIIDQNDAKVTIFQLSSLGRHSIKLVSDIILDDMFKHIQLCGDVSSPATLVIDEVNNISTATGSTFGKMLVESRKYGLSIISSTQFLKFSNTCSNGEIIRQLEQASTKVYFKPAERDFKDLASILGANSNMNWLEVIRRLSRGKAIVETGQSYENEIDKLVYVYPIEELLKTIGQYNTIEAIDS
ncbi:MAG: ATP-binding protein [Lachnospirales bacterium]